MSRKISLRPVDAQFATRFSDCKARNPSKTVGADTVFEGATNSARWGAGRRCFRVPTSCRFCSSGMAEGGYGRLIAIGTITHISAVLEWVFAVPGPSVFERYRAVNKLNILCHWLE